MLIILILTLCQNLYQYFLQLHAGDDSKRQKRLDHGKEGNLMMYLACLYHLMTAFQIQLLKETSTLTY